MRIFVGSYFALSATGSNLTNGFFFGALRYPDTTPGYCSLFVSPILNVNDLSMSSILINILT